MRIAGFEIRKLLCQKSLLVILILCAVANFLIVFLGEKMSHSYAPQMYVELISDLSDMTAEEAQAQVSGRQEKLRELIWEPGVPEEEMEADLDLYTGDVWAEEELLSDIMDELEKVAGYREYLNHIQEEASAMKSVSIFQRDTGFSTKNIEKTAEDFSGLFNIVPVVDVSPGVVMATGQDATDFIMVFFLAALGAVMVFGEKQEGLLRLIAPTELGRQRTVAAKQAAMTVALSGAAAILYGENFTLAALQYGFGDLSRPVQSIGAFQSCVLEISVAQYFCLYFAGKLLLYLVFALIFFMICLMGRNMLRVVFVYVIVLGGSAALHGLVAENSAFMALRYLNLFYFLQTDEILTVYKNINFFGYPVSLLKSGMCILILMAVILLLLGIWSVRGSRFLQTASGKAFFQKKVRYRTGNIQKFEYLKLMKKNGALWILILFAAVQIYRISDYNYFLQSDDIYYKKYMDYLSGPVTEKTADYVEEENARYASLYEAFSQTEDISRKSEIGQELLPAEAWEQVAAEYERICSAEYTEGVRLSMVYPGGYYKLMGQDEQRDMICASLSGALLCVCLASVFAGDRGCGMDSLISTTAGGRRDTLRARERVSFLTALLIFVLVYGGDFLMIFLKIGLKEWQAPIQSLSLFAQCPVPIRLWQYMILLYAVKWIGMLGCLGIVRIVSLLSRDTFRAALISAIILELPALLGLVGIEAIRYLSLVPLLSGNGILNGFIEGSGICYGTIFLLAGAGITGFSRWYPGVRKFAEVLNG